MSKMSICCSFSLWRVRHNIIIIITYRKLTCRRHDNIHIKALCCSSSHLKIVNEILSTHSTMLHSWIKLTQLMPSSPAMFPHDPRVTLMLAWLFFISVHFPEHCQEIAVEPFRVELGASFPYLVRASSAATHYYIYSLLCFEKNFFVNK